MVPFHPRLTGHGESVRGTFPGVLTMFRRTGSSIGCSIVEDLVSIVRLHWSSPPQVTLHVDTRQVPVEGQRADPSPRSIPASLRRVMAGSLRALPEVVTCLPPGQVRYHRLRFAPIPDEELPAAVFWQASRELGCDSQSLRTDFYDVGEVVDSGKRRREVIAVAASNADLNAHVDKLRKVGLSPNAIDTTAGALARCLVPLAPGGEDPWLVLDLGVPTSTLIVVRNGVPRFIHSVSRPHANDLVQLASDLTSEINLCLHYLSGAGHEQCQPGMGCVVGAGSEQEKVLATLNEGAELEFRQFADCLSAPLRATAAELPPHGRIDHWLVLLGLALYGRESMLRGVAA